MFKRQAGLFIVHIPYAGGAGAAGAAVGPGRLHFDNLATASANIRSGKLKALAVTTATRSAAMPDLPTVAEAGATSAGGVRHPHLVRPVRPGPPAGRRDARLNKAFVDALGTPELKAAWRR
jgi:tripartite-type tricarboxylate transporter receptor subunit TctC